LNAISSHEPIVVSVAIDWISSELENEVQGREKDDQIKQHDAESVPFTVRLWPPDPARKAC